MATHTIHLFPARHGKAEMFYLGKSLGTSSQPIYAAARKLLEMGVAAEDEIHTVRDDTVCLRSLVGLAALRSVLENAKQGPTTRPYHQFEGIND